MENLASLKISDLWVSLEKAAEIIGRSYPRIVQLQREGKFVSRVNFGRNYYVLRREAEAIRDSSGSTLPIEGFAVSQDEAVVAQSYHSILEVAEILGVSKTSAAEKFKSIFKDEVIEMDDGTKLIHRDVLDRYAEKEGIDVNEISFMVRLPRAEKRKLEKHLAETGSSLDSWLLKQVQNLK